MRLYAAPNQIVLDHIGEKWRRRKGREKVLDHICSPLKDERCIRWSTIYGQLTSECYPSAGTNETAEAALLNDSPTKNQKQWCKSLSVKTILDVITQVHSFFCNSWGTVDAALCIRFTDSAWWHQQIAGRFTWRTPRATQQIFDGLASYYRSSVKSMIFIMTIQRHERHIPYGHVYTH